MDTLKASEFDIEDRVLLLEPDDYYDLGPENPAVGTEWECPGTVYEAGYGEVHVRWDNKSTNVYKDFELCYAEAPAEGICTSIWDSKTRRRSLDEMESPF
jgi:hypothetical protein